MNRKYSVAELDDLRKACEHKWIFGRYNPMQINILFSRCYQEPEKTNAVEQMVRTHMIAGHTAKDLYASENPIPSTQSTKGGE